MVLVGEFEVFREDIEVFVEVLEQEMGCGDDRGDGENRVQVKRVEGEFHTQFLMDMLAGRMEREGGQAAVMREWFAGKF